MAKTKPILSQIDGVTTTASELNKLDGVTATASEINTLAGITATTSELNKLDGVTATTSELNYVSGVTSAVQTQLNAKISINANGSLTLPTTTSDPTSPSAGHSYFNSSTKKLKIYDGTSWGSVVFSPLGTESNPAGSALEIIDAGTDDGDGLYWLKNSNINNGTAFQAYCDMTKDGGGWILLLTVRADAVGYMGWNNTTVQSRNTSSPSLQNPYSILSWGDYLKQSASGWQWMVEANDTYTTRYTYGGIFTANGSYTINGTSPSQTNISVDEWFNLSGFVENQGVGPRVPWRDTSQSQSGVALYTTYPGTSSWWGTIVQSDASYSSYKTGPWISGTFQAPLYKRVWIR
jgi:hypothetical protein